MRRCTSLSLPPDAAFSRESARPGEFRQPGFDVDHDRSTLFYDAFFNADQNALVFLGPPLLNLASLLFRARLGSRPFQHMISHVHMRDRCCDIWIPGWKSPSFTWEFEFATYALTAQSTDVDSYRGKRVLFTLSRDNELPWIVDWARFHICNHGADGVLLYDNASTRYSAAALENCLRDALPTVQVNVVEWPFKYGPGGLTKESWWDSDYCQAGAFQDARFRFLSTAESVLNCDIDELVVSRRGDSIFEVTEKRSSGYTLFAGRWISNAVPSSGGSRDDSALYRHRDFRFLEKGDDGWCPSKWCVVPRRCLLEHQWSTHAIKGMSSTASSLFSYRHFRNISTNWKYRRTGCVAPDSRIHQFDTTLDRALAKART